VTLTDAFGALFFVKKKKKHQDAVHSYGESKAGVKRVIFGIQVPTSLFFSKGHTQKSTIASTEL
jgi:hypothetical protein